MIKTYQGVVYPWQCDHMNHMNVQFYTSKFDEAAWNLFTLIGLTPKYLKENHCGMAALEQTIKYKSEVLAGESIYVESEVLELKNKILKMKHVMKSLETSKTVAETEITTCHIDTEKRKGKTIPQFVIDNIKKM